MPEQGGDALGGEHQDEADHRQDDGGLRAPAALLSALGHQDEARPDDGEDTEAGAGRRPSP